MFDNSIIGLQDVPSGMDATALARRLVNPGGQLTLVRIHGGYRVVASGVSPARASAERGLAESELNRTSRATGIPRVLALGATSVADGLTRAMRETQADLAVLCAAQVLSPTENLVAALGQMPAPVAITSFYGRDEANPIQTVGVAYDGSPESDRALTVARRVAGHLGAALTGFQITARQSLGGNAAAQRAGEELTAFAANVDLLVVGPRPTRPLRRLLGPGTISEVIGASPTPMLLVPAGARMLPAPSQGPVAEEWVAVAERPSALLR